MLAASTTIHTQTTVSAGGALWFGIVMLTLPSILGSIALLVALWCSRRTQSKP